MQCCRHILLKSMRLPLPCCTHTPNHHPHPTAEMWLMPYSGWTGIGWAHPGRFWCHCRMVCARPPARVLPATQYSTPELRCCMLTSPASCRLPADCLLYRPPFVPPPVPPQVYLPMSYVYGRRGTCASSPLTEALRQELYPLPYGDIDWNKARCVFVCLSGCGESSSNSCARGVAPRGRASAVAASALERQPAPRTSLASPALSLRTLPLLPPCPSLPRPFLSPAGTRAPRRTSTTRTPWCRTCCGGRCTALASRC